MKAFWIVLVVCLLVGPVMAVQLNYQNPTDFTDLTNCTVTTGLQCSWNGSATGQNSNAMAYGAGGGNAFVMYGTASPTTYAAGTINVKAWTFAPGLIRLYDGSKTTQYTFTLADATSPINSRHEVVISSGTARLYINGIFFANSTPLSQNPSYVGFGSSSTGGAGSQTWWDDLVYGATEDTNVLDAPFNTYMKKDFVNPASSGLFNSTTNALINSNNIAMSFSRSNLSGQCLINESIYLINQQTGTVYETQYTGTQCSGQRNFDFGTSLVAANAPYGWYQWKLNNTLSDRVAYIANGANINFDMTDYSIGDNATITYLVDPAYWLPGTYTYRIEIVDVFGTVHNSQNIATSSGSVSYTWTDADTQGVYFAEIIADRISDGENILMNYDQATVTATFGFNGFVKDGGNASIISGALVNYAQGNLADNATSGFDGNYSVSGFLTGIPIWANVSATGYQTQNFTFVVQNGHTITRNISLNATSPTFMGRAVGGVARDGIFTSPNSITNGYGRPIAGATCFLKNTSNSELYSNTTNNAGGYLFDENTPVYLTSGRPYDLWCQRSGYSNSQNYTVVVT